MLDDFLLRAGLAALGVALAAAPLGCFVVWRRMAYFGDATAHASILGVALALALTAPVFGGVLLAAGGMGLAVALLTERGHPPDAALGVLAHAGLAAGIVAASLLPGPRLDLEAYLFGDVLAVGRADLAAIWAGGAVVAGILAWRWRRLVTATLGRDLAFAAGIDPRRETLWLTLALALFVAVAIKVVGALLVTALLIMPAAAARPFARSPETMALAAGALAAGSAVGGLWGAWTFDTPAGPSIVVAAALLFLASAAADAARR